ncbi:MAG: host-nuclease inhibitor Gam family protein [Zoogloeaceae bacterium]|jgi:phage host-nuclease inhibitor protein Gam|nr:host-nuclease inhibitor Gam family protein [Zoogloeaceae bacterium]
MARQKTTAALYVCQSKEETMNAIKELGDAQRALIRLDTELSDEIAAIRAREIPQIEAYRARIETLTAGVHGWCEANRSTLCEKGAKTANLITGEVSWRIRPASVSVRNKDAVMQTLLDNGMTEFLRMTADIDKEAIRANPQAVRDIKGITVGSTGEDFAILPFEVEVAV